MPAAKSTEFIRKTDWKLALPLSAIIAACGIYVCSFAGDPGGRGVRLFADGISLQADQGRGMWSERNQSVLRDTIEADANAAASSGAGVHGFASSLDASRFGVGRDPIPSIDDPVFVAADDERLERLYAGNVRDIGDLPVIGYEHDGDARAYPVPLLSGRELVNDTVGGKPVTIGW